MDFTIFSDTSLSFSMMTTIWVGVWVLCLLNLLWGFTLSGLIVPGFLVPLTMSFPLSGVLIVIESILAWAIVKGICVLLIKMGLGSKLFGRDRFFLILLSSIFVRIFIEGGVLPLLAHYSSSTFVALDLQHSTTAFGLILVPLMANQIWKPGLRYGLLSALISCLLTFIVIKWFLIPFTDFNFNSMSLHMDRAAQYLPDSPKSYILLMTTVFIASQFNLKYGWDIAGILFPGLIALSFFDPIKIVCTILETLVIAALAGVLIRSFNLKGKILEGAYGLLFFFNLAFVYKMTLGILVARLLSLNPEDFLGLGYVMSTVFAMKIVKKVGFGWQLLSSIGSLSFAGIVLGLCISFGLLGILPKESPVIQKNRADYFAAVDHRNVAVYHETSLENFIRVKSPDNPSLTGGLDEGVAYRKLSPSDLNIFTKQIITPLFTLVGSWRQAGLAINVEPGSRDISELSAINGIADNLGFEISILNMPGKNRQLIVLSDAGSNLNVNHSQLGFLSISVGNERHRGLVLDQPSLGRNNLEFAMWLHQQSQGGFLLFTHPTSSSATNDEPAVTLAGSILASLGHRSVFQVDEVFEIRVGNEVSSEKDTAESLYRVEISPSLDADSMAAKNLINTFHNIHFSMVQKSSDTSNLRLAGILRVAGLSLHAMDVSRECLFRFQPLAGPSVWERNWHIMGREKITTEFRSSEGALDWQADEVVAKGISSYLRTQNPLFLLDIEKRNKDYRFDLVYSAKDMATSLRLSRKSSKTKKYLRLTGFDAVVGRAQALKLESSEDKRKL